MKLIEKLTPEQEVQLAPFHAEWLAHGLSTARADRATAEAAILAMRAEIGVEKRPVFIWTESPATALMALVVLRSPEWKRYVESLGSSLESSLGSSLWSSLWSSLRSSLESSLGDAWWGQHSAYWIAFYVFCRDVVGVRYDDKRSRQLDLWADIARSCCWWWCYENYVVISERPTTATLDDRGRLHSGTGPALSFADGWQVHSWHGTTVPAEWIEAPQTVDPGLALSWENVEQRRSLAEIIGWAKVLQRVHAKPVDTDTPDIGTLMEVDLPGSEGARFLKVRCGTGRDFVLPVPAECKTAREANAWTFGLRADELNLETRT